MSLYYKEIEFDKNMCINEIEHVINVLNGFDSHVFKSENCKLLPNVNEFLTNLLDCYKNDTIYFGIETDFYEIANSIKTENYSTNTLKYAFENDGEDLPDEYLYALLYFNFVQPYCNCGNLLEQYNAYLKHEVPLSFLN